MTRPRPQIIRFILALSALGVAISVAAIALGQSSTPGSDVPPDLTSALSRRGVTLGPPPDGAPTTSQDEAIAATGTLPGAAGQLEAAYFVSFTDENVGAQSSEGGELEKEYVNRAAWLVVYRNSIQPVFGPPSDSDQAKTFVSDLAAFVDASTGEFLEALTLEPE